MFNHMVMNLLLDQIMFIITIELAMIVHIDYVIHHIMK